MNDVAQNIHITATLEGCQEKYQSTTIHIEGKICDQPISILIDPGASFSYISPRIIENCKMVSGKFKKLWLVQLALGRKRSHEPH